MSLFSPSAKSPGPNEGLFRVLVLGSLLLTAAACSQEEVYRGQAVEKQTRPALTGQNWNGERFQLTDVSGKVAMVFFGYTYCPDICPFTLAKVEKLIGRLGGRAEEVAVIFASVDPQRDSVEKLASYVPNFNQSFYGLHLTNPELDEAKDEFDLTVQYGQPKDGPGTNSFYYVDHTGSFFLLDREGRLRVTLPPNAPLEDLEADVRTLLDR